MLEETTMAISALHNYNPPILHRDLKTLNVLVTADYKCKVCDFGLSRLETASNVKTLLKCRGTYAYIACEVYQQKGYFKQSDVYSLAIIMWEFVNRIVTGEYMRPYQDIKMEFQILVQAHTKNKRPVIPPAVPDFFRDTITAAWQPDHTKRPDADQLLVRLEEIKQEYKQNREKWDALCKNKKTKEQIEEKEGKDGGRPKIRRGGGGALSQQSLAATSLLGLTGVGGNNV